MWSVFCTSLCRPSVLGWGGGGGIQDSLRQQRVFEDVNKKLSRLHHVSSLHRRQNGAELSVSSLGVSGWWWIVSHLRTACPPPPTLIGFVDHQTRSLTLMKCRVLLFLRTWNSDKCLLWRQYLSSSLHLTSSGCKHVGKDEACSRTRWQMCASVVFKGDKRAAGRRFLQLWRPEVKW